MRPHCSAGGGAVRAVLGTLVTVMLQGVAAETARAALPGADYLVGALAVQADGKIVVGGQFETLGGKPRAFIGRLNADGSLDEGFNPGADAPITAIAVQADGKIVVSGYFTTLGGEPRAYIARLNANGTLDATFNPGADSMVFSLALQPDGKIVAGGVFNAMGGQERQQIGRLNANGSLDTGFNPGADGPVDALALQADGRIVVGGDFFTLGGHARSRIGRLNANGSLDTAFDPGADAPVLALAVQADGKIVVGGEFITEVAGQPRANIGRINANGSIDAGFNPGADGAVYALALQADGRVVAGGAFTTLGGQPRAAIGRLNAGGSLDTTFNPGANDAVIALAPLANGQTVVGGLFTTLGGLPCQYIGLLNADGTLDLGSDLNVELGAPFRFVPGEVVAYSVLYNNGTSRAVADGVIVVSLPSLAEYVDDSGGGIHWPQRQQLFWKLGTIAPGDVGLLSFRVRFLWGIPSGTKDPAAVHISGSNLTPGEFDVQPYLDYVSTTVTERSPLTEEAVSAERQAYPEIEALYAQAENEGFIFGLASSLAFSTGERMTEIVLLRFEPTFAAMFLRRQDERALATIVGASSYAVRSPGGVQRFDLKTDEWEVASEGTSVGGLGVRMLQATFSKCMVNCIQELIPKNVIKNLIKGASTASKALDCYKAATGDDLSIPKCAQIIKKVPGVSEGIDLGKCNVECEQDPESHYCTKDKTYCDAGDWLWGTLGFDSKVTCKCITDVSTGRAGQYMLCTAIPCAKCQKCVDLGAGPFCVDKSAPAPLIAAATRPVTASSTSDDECSECAQGKDPNAKYGEQGDVFAGQLLEYTITYENVGAGDAFDVFVADTLSEQLDAATLAVADGGELSAASREITWLVGHLAPKGQPGSTGDVSFTVRLKPGLAQGTVVRNQAVVHFPSVPEVTPTNEVINVVQPIAAVPQTVETVAGQPVAIQLQGRGPGGGSLIFAIVGEPLRGELTGTPPAVTYTPSAEFTGPDRLRFTVSDGVTTSRPDEVQILVRPSPSDATPPRVVWTSPADGERLAQFGVTPRLSDASGPLYLPPVLIDFSEAIDPATVTAATIRMVDGRGHAVLLQASYDDLLQRVSLLPREALRAGTPYTVTVTDALTDLNGNPLAAEVAWSFLTGGRLRQRLYPSASP